MWYDNFCSWLKRIKRIGLLPVVARIYQKLVKINHIVFLPFWWPFQILETSDWLVDSDEQPIRSLQYSKSFPKKAKLSFVKFFSILTRPKNRTFLTSMRSVCGRPVMDVKTVWWTMKLLQQSNINSVPKKSFSYLIKTGLPIEILKIFSSFKAKLHQTNNS